MRVVWSSPARRVYRLSNTAPLRASSVSLRGAKRRGNPSLRLPVLSRRPRDARWLGFACILFSLARRRENPVSCRRGRRPRRPAPQTLRLVPPLAGRTLVGIRLHFFSLAGDGKRNIGIRQCAHWLMHMPPACAYIIRIPTAWQKAGYPNGYPAFWHAVRDSNP